MHVGQILRSRYKVIKVLGSGGFGDTYLAEDIDLPGNPKCVVKQLKYNPNPGVLDIAKRLFESEAQVLYKLGNESDRIPKLLAHFEDKGEFYLVQEFVDGEDLSQEICPGRVWSEAEVIELLEGILEVFTIIHNKNIIHRDIKPANLMRRKKDGKIVVIDFGAVKEIGTLMMNPQGRTVPSIAIGTPGYMPSEQSFGQPKLCSDIHAIGMLGIYALTGIKPYELPKDPNNGETIWRNWTNVSEDMADVLDKMVRYHFSERYRSAFDTMDALKTVKPRLKYQPKPKPLLPNQSILQSEITPTPKIQWQPQSQINPRQRREILKTLGWLGAGVGLTIVGGRIFSESSDYLDISNLSLENFDFEIVNLDINGTIANRKKFNAEYFTEDLGNGVSLEMVKIPQGRFIMGSPSGEKQRDDYESPQHEVTVPEFFIGRYQVTQAQYEAITGNNPANFKGENRPIEKVSWNNAKEFCKKLSQKTGRTYRLPSEAEWEYACRAGTTTPFYFGETITTTLANYRGTDWNHKGTIYPGNYIQGPKGEFRQQTTPVGDFPPNAFGLYDIHGNVWEWCEDTWHNNYDGAPTDGSAWIESDNQSKKVIRGGSWSNVPRHCRSAVRNDGVRGLMVGDIGFRVAVAIA